jgi:hypothetical protein
MAMTKEQLLAKQPVKVKAVKISTGEVFVRQMNGRQKGQFDMTLGHWEDFKDGQGIQREQYVRTMEDFRGKLAVHTICDKEGSLLLTMDDLSDLVENMSGPDLATISDAAQELNSITEEAREKLAKNSRGGQDAASSSISAKK